jgi:hypothetical protein
MVVAVQGFIVLFSGAMAYVFAPYLARSLTWFAAKAQPPAPTPPAPPHG